MPDHDRIGTEHQINMAGLLHCPRCSERLVRREIRGHERLVCPSCGYVHYLTPAPVTCVLIARGDSIALVRRKYPPQTGKWCLPAGFVEVSEQPEESARREVKEETGLDIRITGVFDTWASDEDPRTPVVAFAFTAEVIGGTLTPGDDADEAGFFEEDSLPKEIAFSTHERAIARYFSRLRQAKE